MTLEQNKNQLIQMITEAIVGILALYNFIAPYFSLPALVIGTEQITAVVTGLVMLGLLLYAAWKNHNITPESKLSQVVLNKLKDGVLAPEAVTEMVEEADEEMLDTAEDLNQEIEYEVSEFLEENDQP